MEFTLEQMAVVESKSQYNICIAAAGSGKTRTAVGFMNAQDSSKNIVSFTFTNKACNEIKERLGERDNIEVSTIHGFAYKLIKRHSPKRYIMLTDSAQLSLIQGQLKGNKETQKTINIYRSQAVKPTDSYYKPYIDYDHICEQYNYIDFATMATIATDLVQFHSKIDVLCVDEAQDLSKDQMLLISAIIKHHNPQVLLVGDPRQAIYGWRGGMKNPFEYFMSRVADTSLFELTHNFRSCKAICDTGNHVTHLQNLKPVVAALDIEGGVYRETYPTAQIEIMLVVARIRELIASGQRNIAALFRTNHQAKRYEYHLIKSCIQYENWGGVNLLAHNEIKSVLAWLSLLENKNDISASFIAAQDIQGIGKVAARNINLSLPCPANAKQAVIDFYDTYSYLKVEYQQYTDLRSTITLIVDTIGIAEPKLNKNGDVTEKELQASTNRHSRLKILSDLASDFSNAHEFIESISMASDNSETNDESKVILATIHKTKGLEFDHVFVPNLVHGNMPLSDSKGGIADIDEETNIAYVAYTRAKKQLFLSTNLEGKQSDYFE